jgi:predicted nucleic acid-binding protein
VVVLDSSFLIAYHNTRDAHHAAAAQAMPSLTAGAWGPVLLPEYVFLEVVTVLMMRRDLAVASRVARVLLGAREVELVPCSPLFHSAVETFLSQQGSTLSFADAAIVALAESRGAQFVATFDDDFRGVSSVSVVPD